MTIKYTKSVLLTLLAGLPAPVVSGPSVGVVVLGGEVVVVVVVEL